MAAGDFVKFLPINSDPMLFLNIGKCFGILHDFPGVSGYAVFLEFEFSRGTNNAFKIVE
jgi:hypothetical protein